MFLAPKDRLKTVVSEDSTFYDLVADSLDVPPVGAEARIATALTRIHLVGYEGTESQPLDRPYAIIAHADVNVERSSHGGSLSNNLIHASGALMLYLVANSSDADFATSYRAFAALVGDIMSTIISEAGADDDDGNHVPFIGISIEGDAARTPINERQPNDETKDMENDYWSIGLKVLYGL